MADLTEIIKVWPTCEECVYWTNDDVCKYPDAGEERYFRGANDRCSKGLFVVEIDDNYIEWMGNWKGREKKERPYALVNYEDYLNVKNPHVG